MRRLPTTALLLALTFSACGGDATGEADTVATVDTVEAVDTEAADTAPTAPLKIRR